MPEPVILPGVEIGPIGDESDDPVVGQPVRCPADEPLIHVVLLGLLGCAGRDVGLADVAIDGRILAVLVVVVLVLLVGVVRRVADNHADWLLVLLLDPDPVLLRHPAQVERTLPLDRAARRTGLLPVHIVQRVHEAEVGEFQVLSGALPVTVLYVQVGDVVGQDSHFVGVDLVQVLVLQPVGGQVVDQAGDEGAGACRRVEDLHVVVGQAPAEVILQQVIRAPDDEIHHLVGCVHHPQAVGGGGIVRLVEVLVDRLQELLLFRVLGNLVVGPADGPVVGRFRGQ